VIELTEVLEVIKKIAGLTEIDECSVLQELDVDSTILLEILIELEIQLDIDLLDEQLDLDALQTGKDIYDFLRLIMNKPDESQ